MDIVYLFYEEDRIRIPLFNFDPALFRRLLPFGSWDKQNGQFVLKYRLETARYGEIFEGRPCVEAGKNGQETIIYGFLGRPWYNSGGPAGDECRDSGAGNAVPDHVCLAAAVPAFEPFSNEWVKRLITELHSRKYSRSTIQSYVYHNRAFCRVIQKTPREITGQDFKRYLAYLDKGKSLSSSTMNLAISAIKFFYAAVLKKDFGEEQRRPRRDKRLPGVLSGAEIRELLDAEKNPKHRLLLMLAYSSGLRVSEVVQIKKTDVDFSRKSIIVRGKGRKERYTMLSERAAAFIKEYCELFTIEHWLFPGQSNRSHLSVRSAQNVFEKALRKTMIRKDVSIHSLRHSFATHLLENGTDVRYIQSFLGHANLRTTERYTHIARKSLLKIQSPLDTLRTDNSL